MLFRSNSCHNNHLDGKDDQQSHASGDDDNRPNYHNNSSSSSHSSAQVRIQEMRIEQDSSAQDPIETEIKILSKENKKEDKRRRESRIER